MLASVVLAGLLGACLGAASGPASRLATEVGGLLPGTGNAPATSPVGSGDPMGEALLLVAGCCGALAAARLWGTVTTTCWQAAHRIGTPAPGNLGPSTPGRGSLGRGTFGRGSLVQRLTLAACGLGVATVAVVPAHAADLSGLDGLPHPDRPTHGRIVVPEAQPPALDEHADRSVRGRTAPASPAAPADDDGATPLPPVRAASSESAAPRPPAPGAARVHRVRSGDTLWDLAEEQLSGRRPDGEAAPATTRPHAAEVAAQVRSLHHTNRSVVGADPDLLLPGQELRLPDAPEPDDSHVGATDPNPAPAPAPAPAEENR